jgi:hypothetical protein
MAGEMNKPRAWTGSNGSVQVLARHYRPWAFINPDAGPDAGKQRFEHAGRRHMAVILDP